MKIKAILSAPPSQKCWPKSLPQYTASIAQIVRFWVKIVKMGNIHGVSSVTSNVVFKATDAEKTKNWV